MGIPAHRDFSSRSERYRPSRTHRYIYDHTHPNENANADQNPHAHQNTHADLSPGHERPGAARSRGYRPLRRRDQAATAKIINKYPSAAVAILGDNAYESGSLSEYQTCYNPSWGAFKNRTYPAPGNHDFLTSGGRRVLQLFWRCRRNARQGVLQL